MTTKATAAKKTTRKPSAKNLKANMEMGAALGASIPDDGLASLLADLGMPAEPPMSEEIIESAEPNELELEAAVNAAETQEVIAKSYDGDGEVHFSPTADDTSAPIEDKAAKKAAAKAEREAAKLARAEERAKKKAEREAEKAARPTRKFYASKVERVSDKLGADLGSYTVLTFADATLTGDDLAAKQQETLDALAAAGQKVQNRMTLLLEYVAGKSSKLNEVIQRAFILLKKDGHIKTGEKGNFHLDLLAKPYSAAAARAMGNNTIAAMRLLKVIEKNEEGTYVPNAESLILVKVNGMLGL